VKPELDVMLIFDHKKFCYYNLLQLFMKKITLLLIAIFTISVSFGQSAWKKVEAISLEKSVKVARKSMPTSFELFQLDLALFKQQLDGAPVRGTFSGRSKQIIYLPNQEGVLERFYVMETPIMEPELARKFPMIKSYAAQGLDNPGAMARFSVTQFGLHSMTFATEKETLFIDPYTADTENYIVYTKSAISHTPQDFECLLNETNVGVAESTSDTESSVNAADDSKLRTYRLALSCTGEYGAIFGGTGTVQQRKANIQAQMAITMTRVNGVYEKDLSITMIFVANNDAIIYFDGFTDPWANEYNTQTAVVIDAAIGLANYDIGHNFNTSGGGNAGCIGCVCSTTSAPNSQTHKGRGFTGLANPTGDAFDIDYVAHEMGHQFGGFHTQSNANCFSGSGSTEVEPGSGSTIMGYAGICAANVQNNSDDYFHYVNIRDITANVKSGVSASCAQITNFTNAAPVITPLSNYIIPISTPFELRGSATDPNGDVLTYTWEQNDPQSFGSANNLPPNANNVVGPLFRSVRGTSNPSRFFPRMNSILSGQNSNTWEVLPAVERTMNFALTVRDNAAGGSQTSSDEMQVSVAGLAGPFFITSQNTSGISYIGGSNQTITWEVSGTDLAPVNARFVDIYLSTNNGGSFPILLASQVPNDGSEIVTLPNTPGTTNRIMVKGHNNIFFDVSNSAFTITAAPASFALAFSGTAGEQNKSVCKGGSLTFTLAYTTFGTFNTATTFAATNLPAGVTASFSPASATASTNVVVTLVSATSTVPALYTIPIQATSGSVVRTVNIYAGILESNFAAVNLVSPASGSQVNPDLVTFNWTASNGAELYDIQIATDANFNAIVQQATVSTTSFTTSSLGNSQTYFWRILPKNQGCSGTFGTASTFSTIFCGLTNSTNVPVNIPTIVATVSSTLVVPQADNVVINDVNVQLAITHSWVSDLVVRLTSPTGTQVILFASQCDSNSNVNAVFDDSGQPLVCGANPAISGLLIPQQALSAFNGQNSQGTWTLTVNDTFNQDGGAITNWGLVFCSQAAPLSVVKNDLTQFMVYPNPNKGNFNIKFNNAFSDKVEINVHDMSGRSIFKKNYTVQGDFNENITLDTVQSGVYLLSVFDGEQTQTQRIIIN